MKSLLRPILVAACCGGTLVAAPKPEPHLPVPSKAHIKWHKAEQKMFIHFGIKTYKPSRWHMGNGKEDPKIFNPTKLDANQWVAAAKAGGFNGIVFTVKHHSGWCNWPSKTTRFGVVSAPWKGGKGDVIKEYVAACRKAGLSVGFHITIIDENYKHRNGGYEGYNKFYYKQWEELVTWYGPFDYYYVDGYELRQMPKGFDFKPVAELIKKHQPDAVFYDSAVLVDYIPARCLDWPGGHGGVRPDMGYVRNRRGKKIWYPLEPSMMFQGTWFHSKQPITDLHTMCEKYLISAGRGSTVNLNVPPNQDGLIDEHSIGRLKEYKAWMDNMYASDWARKGATIKADSTRGNDKQYAAVNMLDDDYETYWATDDNVKGGVIEIDLGKKRSIDGVVLQEYVFLGERVNGYTVEYFIDGEWHEMFSGKRIGYKRILWGELEGNMIDGNYVNQASKVRLTLKNAEACPLVSTFKVLGSPDGKNVILGLKTNEPKGDTITCQAKDAGLAGGGLRGFFYWHGKLEGWKKLSDKARWKISIKEPGEYTVTIHQGDDKGGDDFNLEVAGNKLPCKVIATHGYANFKDSKLGVVKIDKPGDYILSITPVKILNNDLMKLRWVKLKKR
jgi:alpha-L-fucosidase